MYVLLICLRTSAFCCSVCLSVMKVYTFMVFHIRVCEEKKPTSPSLDFIAHCAFLLSLPSFPHAPTYLPSFSFPFLLPTYLANFLTFPHSFLAMYLPSFPSSFPKTYLPSYFLSSILLTYLTGFPHSFFSPPYLSTFLSSYLQLCPPTFFFPPLPSFLPTYLLPPPSASVRSHPPTYLSSLLVTPLTFPSSSYLHMNVLTYIIY